MNRLPEWIVEATPENYRQLVLENSRRGPVMVYFWSPDAGPCNMLLPRLIKVGEEMGGRFLLALLNTDQYTRFARDMGVISVPTVKIIHHEQDMETVRGAFSERTFRDLVEKYVPQQRIKVHGDALQAWARGDQRSALSLMEKAQAQNPANLRIPLDRAKMLMQASRLDDALAVIENLPDAARDDADISTLEAHLRFLVAARDAPGPDELQAELEQNPDDLDTRFQLAARLVTEDAFEPALEQLLAIVQNNSQYRNDLARKGMLAIIKLMGDSRDISDKYRELLRKALH